MSAEQVLLAHARPHIITEKARALVRAEASKGCLPQIAPGPVFLEPPYQPMLAVQDAYHPPQAWNLHPPICEADYSRFQVWIPPDQVCDWKRSERFLKQLRSILHHAGIEIIGNQEDIRIQLLCHAVDVPVVRNAFLSEFPQCELSPAPIQLVPDQAWKTISLQDYYPSPWYPRLLTRPDELNTTLYGPIFQALSTIPAPGIGIYQTVFAPVCLAHDWHRNTQAMLDIEFNIKSIGGMFSLQRYAQQVPSGDLRQMAMDVETKAHTDKPFFAAAMRLAVLGIPNTEEQLASLATFGNLIQHGGYSQNCLREGEYAASLGPECFRDMFTLGLAYRPGFLVNSWELTSLVHVPAIQLAEPRKLPIKALEPLPADPSLSVGIPIGTCFYAGRDLSVCIPPSVRSDHVHVLGRPGMGKTTTLVHMILADIEQGHGVAVLDPHGDLVSDLLNLIPKHVADHVIYADPGDPEYVLTWNPLARPPGDAIDRGRVADDIVSSFKTFTDGWGDRLEHLLRHAIEGVMYLPQGNLLDVSSVLNRYSSEGKALRERIKKLADNEICRRFWNEDFSHYTKSDQLTPPQHKLSKMLNSGSLSLMLCQRDSAFQFRQIMDEGKILLVNLANLGSEQRNILGCFMLSLLHLAALGRSSQPRDQRRPFHTYCDEAHRFMTDALDDLITETRKFKVSLTLAHQNMKQFNAPKNAGKAVALSNVGSTILFSIDGEDARYLQKDMRGMVEALELTRLEKFEAIARIDTKVVRMKTLGPPQVPHQQLPRANHRRLPKALLPTC